MAPPSPPLTTFLARVIFTEMSMRKYYVYYYFTWCPQGTSGRYGVVA
ncbi:hypothetical protein Dform_00186 [Dehalogenimonas formicexedens]|uniref:Uncharacterized protein n=1 Tax=Dehalogenimonas formicexedens TaxID=1839801 RepID=A0A1P8F4Z7_9CHLR|nr:hypothetical protein Dform_00186 [Dehalogenimonas formicexedens]